MLSCDWPPTIKETTNRTNRPNVKEGTQKTMNKQKDFRNVHNHYVHELQEEKLV